MRFQMSNAALQVLALSCSRGHSCRLDVSESYFWPYDLGYLQELLETDP